MRISVAVHGLAAVLVFLAAGCSNSAATELMKDTITTMNEIASTLETIKDDKSADEAIPKLDTQVARLRELKRKREEMKLSPGDDRKLQEKYKPELEQTLTRYHSAELAAMKNAPRRARAIGDALMKVQ